MLMETYTLRCWERHITELLEEEHACHRWHQVHNEVVIHHAPRIQLQTFEVIRAEVSHQLWAAENCYDERQVRLGWGLRWRNQIRVFQTEDSYCRYSPWTSYSAKCSVLDSDESCWTGRRAETESADENLRKGKKNCSKGAWQAWAHQFSSGSVSMFTFREGRKPLALLRGFICI